MLPPAGSRRTEQRGRSSIDGQGAQQLRQLRHIGGDAPGLLAGEEVRCRSMARLIFEVGIGQRLPLAVADDDAGVCLLDGPGRREAARLHH
jgi:hypothetical protein